MHNVNLHRLKVGAQGVRSEETALYMGILTRHALMGNVVNRLMVGRMWLTSRMALRVIHTASMT